MRGKSLALAGLLAVAAIALSGQSAQAQYHHGYGGYHGGYYGGGYRPYYGGAYYAPRPVVVAPSYGYASIGTPVLSAGFGSPVLSAGFGSPYSYGPVYRPYYGGYGYPGVGVNLGVVIR